MVAKCSKNINETKWLKGIVGTTVCMQFTETWNDENVNFIVLEPWNEEINSKKTTAVKDAIYTVMTRKPEKKRLAEIRTLTCAILVQCVTKELANH